MKKAAAAKTDKPPPKAAPEPESRTALVRRARRINRELAEVYPYAHPELDFENPFQLLVATVLSAQTTDLRVNQTTPALFAKYPTPEDLAAANPEEVEEILRPTGFFRAKTKSVHRPVQGPARTSSAARSPAASKTSSSCPASAARPPSSCWATPSGGPGITVDTHFGRLVRRWQWTDETDPDKVEAAVGALFPKSDWTMLSHHVIFHGRRICHARKPACGACPIAPLCPAYGEGETDPEKAKKLLKYEKGGFPGQRLKPPQSYLDAGGIPAPPLGADRRRRRHGASDASRNERRGRRRCGQWTGGAVTHAHSEAHEERVTRIEPVRLSREGLPDWLDPVVQAAETVEPLQLSRFLPPDERRGAAVRRADPLRRGRARPRAAAHGARQLAALARRPALLPRRRPRPGGRRSATATGRCGPRCARPRRRPGSTRAASSSSACCRSSTSR